MCLLFANRRVRERDTDAAREHMERCARCLARIDELMAKNASIQERLIATGVYGGDLGCRVPRCAAGGDAEL